MRLALELPGRWFSLPIGDPGARSRIRELTDALHGRRDDRAGARIALRRRLEAALEGAEASRAEQVHLGIALEADVPLPAVASVYPGISVAATATSHDPDAVMAALVPLVLRAAHEPAGGTAEPGKDDRVFTAGRSRILRRPRLHHGGAHELPSLAIDYWITVPGARRAVLLHLDVPLLAPEALLLALCDAIALAARFERASGLTEELRAST